MTIENTKNTDEQIGLEIESAIVHSSPLPCSTTFKLVSRGLLKGNARDPV